MLRLLRERTACYVAFFVSRVRLQPGTRASESSALTIGHHPIFIRLFSFADFSWFWRNVELQHDTTSKLNDDAMPTPHGIINSYSVQLLSRTLTAFIGSSYLKCL